MPDLFIFPIEIKVSDTFIPQTGINALFNDDVLVKYDDHRKLEKILSYYIDEQPAERADMTRKAFEIVKENFTYDAIARSLLRK